MVTGSTKLNYTRKERVAHDQTSQDTSQTKMDMEENHPETRPLEEHHQDPPLWEGTDNEILLSKDMIDGEDAGNPTPTQSLLLARDGREPQELRDGSRERFQ